MIRRLRSLILLAVLATPVVAHAEVRTGAFTLAPMLGYQGFNSGLDLENAAVYGVAFGYNATRNWALELDLRYASTEADFSGGPDVEAWSASGNILYHLLPEGAVVPYLLVGIGGLQYNIDHNSHDDEDFIVNLGGGFKCAVTETVDLRFDLRNTIDLRTDNQFNKQDDTVSNFAAMIGLNFQLGGYSSAPVRSARQALPPVNPPPPPPVQAAAATPAPAGPVDGDLDGVTNGADRCPGTAPGVRVDASGCPADTDRDGVADYLDACLDTPRGVRTDQRGCAQGTVQGADSLPLKIAFGTGKVEITPFHYRELDRAATFIRQHPQTQILVEVPADAQGLSQLRAESLRRALISRYGLAAGQLVARGDSLGGQGVIVSVIP